MIWKAGIIAPRFIARYHRKLHLKTEAPAHEVTIAAPFLVSKHQVTFAQWDTCVAFGGCRGYYPKDEGWGRGSRPVINVSWHDAHSYVRWLSEEAGEEYRLLSEAEWEYAARAGSTTKYSWGREIGGNRACCKGCGSPWDTKKRTAPVGSFVANAFGLHDMHGNVWEWVEDYWHDDYRGAPVDGSSWLDWDNSLRIFRGGSWQEPASFQRSSMRFHTNPTFRSSIVGFRIARSARPAF